MYSSYSSISAPHDASWLCQPKAPVVTYWTMGEVALYSIKVCTPVVKLLSCECHKTLQNISQRWHGLFACQLVVVSEEVITWAYGGTRPQLVRHVDYSYHTHSHCTHFFNNEMYSGWICAHWFTKDREKMAATLQTMFSVAPMLLNFDSKFIDICSYGSNWQWINIGLDGLVPIRRQAIIWTNNGLSLWRIYASLAVDVLIWYLYAHVWNWLHS